MNVTETSEVKLKNPYRRGFIRQLTAAGAGWALTGIGHPEKHLSVLHSDPAINSLQEAETWKKLGNSVYGARPDGTGPLGGGQGYRNSLTTGDYEVRDLDSLIDALGKAKSGEIVYIPDETVIDLTTYIYIDEFVLEIPEGVTLAGNRGMDNSAGGQLTSDALRTPVMIRALGPGVRITGLRIQGPNPKRYMAHHRKSFQPGGPRHAYYYKFPVSAGISTEFDNLEVDNCDISAFSRTAISLPHGQDHHIHHNYIHHCQYNGLGYGTSQGISTALIEYNLFDHNRHSIAGTGAPGCSYIARHNVELGTSLSHCFDMHGGKDRKDGTTIAGTDIEIYNNTFRAPEYAIGIRGEPENTCDIHHNWFVRHMETEEAVRPYPYKKRNVYDNIYGVNPTTPK